MSYTLILKGEAVADIQEAYDFYDDETTGLGIRFLQEPDKRFEAVTQNPLHYSYCLDQKMYRSCSLKHFPFSIIFEVTAAEVIVFAVHDHRRHPDKTSQRFDS